MKANNRALPMKWLVAAGMLALPMTVAAQQPACDRVSFYDSVAAEASMAALEATIDVPQDRRAQAIIDRFTAELSQRVTTGEVYAALAGCFIRAIPEGSFARSFSSATSNPVAGGILERSGFSDLFSLAVDGLFFGSDETAVTINLNALALFGMGKDSVYSSPAEFQKAAPLRRWAGSFTFGSKIPGKTITGFSGFPDADSLFDAISWDVRLRIIGDRDPRAKQWESLLRSVAVEGNATAALINAVAQVFTNPTEAARLRVDASLLTTLRAALEDRAEATLDGAMRQLRNSWQVTLKTAGQHLSDMGDADKWSVVLLVDRGIGEFGDFTLNASYSRSTGTSMFTGGETSGLSQPLAPGDILDIGHLDKLEFNAGLTTTILRDVIAPGRGAELVAAARVEIPLSDDVMLMAASANTPLDIDRNAVWKANATLTLPLSEAGRIPLSITYTNDSRALDDQKFVEGRLGLSWDFASITNALKRLAGI